MVIGLGDTGLCCEELHQSVSAILHSSAHGATLGALWLCPAPLRMSIEAGSWQALGSDPIVRSNSQHWKEYGCQGYDGQRFPKHGTRGWVTTRDYKNRGQCTPVQWVGLPVQYKNMAGAVHILLPTAVEATREGCIPPQIPTWLYRRKPPRDRAKMNISNTCQLSSSPDPHPIPPPESAGSDSWG